MYNFDMIYDRRNTCSMKWDCIGEVFCADDILPMWIADMDFPAPEVVIAAIKKRSEHGIFGYTQSMPDLYSGSVINWILKRHQWMVKREWLTLTPGVVPALSAAIMAFTNPGDKILIQSPVYPPFYKIIRNNHRELVDNPLRMESGSYKMDFEDLERKMKTGVKAMILCSPHNPVGRVWSRLELSKLGELCLKYNVLLFSDEIHSDIIFSKYKHIPVASISEELAQYTMTCIAPSKTFGLAGLSAATTIISNVELRKKFIDRIQTIGIEAVNIFGVVASEAAYMYGEEWLEQLLDYLEGNYRLLDCFINENIPKIKVIKSEGTYLVWLDCNLLGMNSQELSSFMIHEAKIGLNDGITFGQNGEGFLRLNIACPRAILREGLKRINEAVKRSM